MKKEESPGTIYFDPDGDVHLLVEGPDGEVTLVVSSQALKLSCAPFKAMLSPYFSEGQPDSNKKIPLPDDNLKALSILLHIAHLQFNQVPSKLEFNELLELSIITDKYAATSLIAPWLSNWISQLERLIDVPGYEAWIWIAWEFGRQDIFAQIANRLVLKAIDGSERDGLLLKDQRTVSSEYLPPDMTEMIIHTRENTISQLCDVVQRYVDLYSDAPYAQSQPICKAQSAHRSECDAIILGSLIQKLKRRKLWPTMGDPSEISTSIEGFSQSLLSMDILCYPERIFHDGRGKDAHAGCSITAALRSELKQVLAEIPSVLQPSHKWHLQAQQEKLINSPITT